MNIEITSGIVKHPKRLVLHGEAGVGKTTLATRLGKKALVIPTEDGSNHLDVDRLPVCSSWDEVIQSLLWVHQKLTSGEIDHDVVVFDSIDWAESFIETAMEAEGFDQSYGKGTIEVGVRIGRILKALDMINKLGVRVVVVSHSECKTLELAEGGSYSRWQPKLTKRANAKLQEWSDAIMFCTVEVMVREESTGFSKRGVGAATGRRVGNLTPSAGHVAKCRTDATVKSVYDLSDVESILEVL